jgi:AAA family ATP:ADP antiporter
VTEGAHEEAGAGRARGPLEWLLSPLADLRGGEGLTALALAAQVFVLLFGYYLLKVTREALITPLEGGPRLKAAAAAGMALLLVPLLRGYDALSERVGRAPLLGATTVGFAGCLVVFGALANAWHGSAPLAVAFFVFVGIFNVFVIAQFWSFANDLYAPGAGRRLFGLVAVGSAAGGIVGAKTAKWFFDATAQGRLMFAAAALLFVALGLARSVGARESGRPRASGGAGTAGAPLDAGGGWALLARSRYFQLIALLLVVYNCANSVGEFVLTSGVREAARASGQAPEAFVASFMGDFFGGVNALTLGLQLFVVSRLLSRAGVRVALFVMPVVALGGYLAMGALLTLPVIRAAKTAENALDYSVQSTTRQALWLVATREEKYKAKALVDTFFVRIGDVAAFGVITLGLDVLGLSTRGFALVNVGLVLVWLAVVWGIAREHARRAAVFEAAAPGAPDTESAHASA